MQNLVLGSLTGRPRPARGSWHCHVELRGRGWRVQAEVHAHVTLSVLGQPKPTARLVMAGSKGGLKINFATSALIVNDSNGKVRPSSRRFAESFWSRVKRPSSRRFARSFWSRVKRPSSQPVTQSFRFLFSAYLRACCLYCFLPTITAFCLSLRYACHHPIEACTRKLHILSNLVSQV